MKTMRKQEATAAATPNTKKERSKTTQVVLPFSDIEISKWNRSFGCQPDEQYIHELAKDISHNGLIHPLTLVASKSGGPPYAILAGANRFWALRKLRGDAAGLKEGEYTVRANITADDPRCLDISLSENGHRRQPSVIETARYVDRLLQEEHVDQKKLAPKLHLRREVVNRLSKLVRCFGQLPESWQADLSRSPSQDSKQAPAVTLSHWVEVAGEIGDGKITPEVKGVLENAAEEHWSTRDMRRALVKAAKPEADSQSTEGPAEQVPAKRVVNPIHMLEKAVELIRAAAAAIKADMPEQSEQLSNAVATVEEIRKQIEAAKATTAVGEKVKAA